MHIEELFCHSESCLQESYKVKVESAKLVERAKQLKQSTEDLQRDCANVIAGSRKMRSQTASLLTKLIEN
jgi:hypothetical protein